MDKKGPGRVPRTIECDLKEVLVDSCVPGDVITVCGIVKVDNSEAENRGNQSINQSFKQSINQSSLPPTPTNSTHCFIFFL